MPKELHVYLEGRDEAEFRLDDLVVCVHAGNPPDEKPPAAPQEPAPAVWTPGRLSPPIAALDWSVDPKVLRTVLQRRVGDRARPTAVLRHADTPRSARAQACQLGPLVDALREAGDGDLAVHLVNAPQAAGGDRDGPTGSADEDAGR